MCLHYYIFWVCPCRRGKHCPNAGESEGLITAWMGTTERGYRHVVSWEQSGVMCSLRRDSAEPFLDPLCPNFEKGEDEYHNLSELCDGCKKTKKKRRKGSAGCVLHAKNKKLDASTTDASTHQEFLRNAYARMQADAAAQGPCY